MHSRGASNYFDYSFEYLYLDGRPAAGVLTHEIPLYLPSINKRISTPRLGKMKEKKDIHVCLIDQCSMSNP
jgi:hypothetical protein